jgi:hypothetical protein
MVGLVALVPVAVGLVRETVTVEAAAVRAAVLLVLLAVTDRLVVPLVRDLLAPPQRRRSDLS